MLKFKQQKINELIEANDKQKFDKEVKMAEKTKQELFEYNKIVEKRQRDHENERKKEEELKNAKKENEMEVR